MPVAHLLSGTNMHLRWPLKLTSHWVAPTADAPIRATVQLPGSKSQTNRALVLSALADGESVIKAPLIARDTTLMCNALRQLGAEIETENANSWAVRPINSNTELGSQVLDAGLAGTVMRFILPVAALARGSITIEGDERAKKRPISPLIECLRELEIDVATKDESLPIVITAHGKVTGGHAEIDASASSQFVSALLLAAARFDEGIALIDVGPSLPSQPHVDMTIQMLADAGVEVSRAADDKGHTGWQIEPGPIKAQQWQIEPDLSNAAPFIAAAMVTGGEIEIVDWPITTTQAGDYLRELITAWGGSWEFITTTSHQGVTGRSLLARGPKKVRPIDVNLHAYGELTPVIAAVCACATGQSRLTGIGHLRGHESDRLAAITENLQSIGVLATQSPDGLTISPSQSESHPTQDAKRHGGLWRSFEDHRLATAGAVIGVVTQGVEIDDIDATSKTMPNFTAVWREMFEATKN